MKKKKRTNKIRKNKKRTRVKRLTRKTRRTRKVKRRTRKVKRRTIKKGNSKKEKPKKLTKLGLLWVSAAVEDMKRRIIK